MNKKLILMVIALILVAALAGAATYSWFTGRVSVPNNFFSAGTLELSVTDPEAGAAFSFANMAPSAVRTGSITVKNSGTLDLQFTAVVTGTSSGGENNADLAEMLDVVVTLAKVSGSPRGEVVYEGTLADLIADPYLMHQWTPFDPSWGDEEPRPFAPGMTAQFDVQVTFNQDAGNDYQGASWTGEITFYADQWENTLPFSRENMVLWLDASRGVILDENNRVSQWLDQSGKGNHAVQANPDRRPEYMTADLNGRPTLYFNNEGASGSTSRYLAGTLGGPLGEDFTIFIVTKPINRNYIYTIYGKGDAVVTLRLLNRDWWIRYDEWMTNYLKYVKWIDLPLSEARYRIITMRLDSGAMGAWMEGKLWGTNEIQGSGIQGDCRYGLGADYNGSFMATCNIAEFIVYNTGLSEQERRAVEIHLSTKYGIPLAE